MFLKNARYHGIVRFVPDPDGRVDFPGIRPRPIPPTEAVLEHTVQTGDRLDALARHYYGNDRLWWRILDANPQIIFAGHLLVEEMEGDAILIPRTKE